MKKGKTTIEIYPRKQKLAANAEQTVDVLVRITPPDLDIKGKARPKLNLSLVLDRSGSMNGTKMREAREAVKYCVDQMMAEDRFSTVIFDDQVEAVSLTAQMIDTKKSVIWAF